MWTAKADAALADCNAAGLSRSQTAAVINAKLGTRYSRNAVSGRMDRLGLKAKPMVTPRPRAPWGFFKERVKKHRPRPRPAAPKPPQPAGKPVPLVELQNHHCRAVVAERGADGLAVFCGATAIDGSSYCPAHHQAFHTRGTPSRSGMVLRPWIPWR